MLWTEFWDHCEWKGDLVCVSNGLFGLCFLWYSNYVWCSLFLVPMVFTEAPVLLCILTLRFRRGKPKIITRRYGQRTLKTYRRDMNLFKTKIKERHPKFRSYCNLYGIIPNFLNFKLYEKSLLSPINRGFSNFLAVKLRNIPGNAQNSRR